MEQMMDSSSRKGARCGKETFVEEIGKGLTALNVEIRSNEGMNLL